MIHSHFTSSIAEQTTFEQLNNYSKKIMAMLKYLEGVKGIDKNAIIHLAKQI